MKLSQRLKRHIPLMLAALVLAPIVAAPARAADAPPPPAAVMIEAEDLKPQGPGWKVVAYGQGNYMVDIIGFSHIFGEHVLSAAAGLKDARAVGTVTVPEAGAYRVWSRFEQPTNTENRFRVELRQGGKLIGSAVMGEKDAPKYFFGTNKAVGQYDASWGSEGLVEQGFDVKDLQPGPVEITLVALDQPEPGADRNVDFVFLTRDLEDSWRKNPQAYFAYPILEPVLDAIPTRYFVRLTSPTAQTLNLHHIWNRGRWYVPEGGVTLEANTPSKWVPLRLQDVSHFTALEITAPGKQSLQVRVELASDAAGQHVLRTIDWNDPTSGYFHIIVPPYPDKYPGERIQTDVEQYQAILDYLRAHPSKVGREPTKPLAWGSCLPVWYKGRVADLGAAIYHELGLRSFPFMQAQTDIKPDLERARERFKEWGIAPNRSIAFGAYRQMPTPENVARVKKAAEENGLLPYVQRFDYGDEIAFSEWLAPIKADDMRARFAAWQKQHKGKVEFATPDSSAAAAQKDPVLYVDSQRFYEETAIDYVAGQAREIRKALGPEVVYGANVGCHPFYYPEIAKYIKWFRKTPAGDYAATFGRHSEYFWQIGLPGPLINAYVADHFRAGMRDNPQAQHVQYTMPHSPGNTDESFRRTAFSHLAHGARGLDYFGIGINYSFTENYIDFRDAPRYAAIRDINRAMATIEDILPTSRVVPSKVALILSDSTERWDFAGIAQDKAGFDVFGDNYKKTRLAYHYDRVGLYYALVHGSRSPDLVTEEDVQHGILKDYSVAYWVGDCAETATVKALEGWVRGGGHLVATAGALRFDPYRHPQPEGLALLGLKAATLEEHDRFFRPHIELPHLKPLDWLGEMPTLAMRDTVTTGAAHVLASFKGGQPAVTEHALGKGKVTCIATLPGVAYLWSAYQPAPGERYLVPSRGPASHMTLTKFNTEARRLILAPVRDVMPAVDAGDAWVDARLIASPQGYAVPLSNYSPDTAAPVTLTLRAPRRINKVSSANAGALKPQRNADGSVTVRYAPGLGDILRLE